MKHPVRELSLIIASMAAVPAALAGPEIVKCVDASGHVTLTDQPCSRGAATVRLASAVAASGPSEPYPLAAARNAMPPANRDQHKRTRGKAKPMARDVATLKAARARFLLTDVAEKPGLARLE